ncbi:hypothetical protein CC78DRAFT_584993 [Lojkania enalia]|uniref:SET domain-containing protein n=1 Tax=Lojkania enalia TaxID=147567 RepID=A0A9P4JZW9_9PLEO|nr:hypothetical protein CC78DRAFT_584993 [Didymosphaeria enalia]
MALQKNRNIILLTEEDARIRNKVKDRIQKCSELAGRSREPRDPKSAIGQAASASLMADMATSSDPNSIQAKRWRDNLLVIIVGQPYFPCIVPLLSLEPMNLYDLRMETHHRGRRLTVRGASPVVALTATSWTTIRDELGDGIERLEEPYFTLTEQGEATLRIDHPSDLILVKDPVITRDITSANNEGSGYLKDTEAAVKKVTEYKDKGNIALKHNELLLAHTKYMEGLVFMREVKVSEEFPRRSRFIADAIAALIAKEDKRSKELDGQALFRASCAAYNLGEYQESKAFAREQLKLTPLDKDARANLRRIENRLHEQGHGTYDINAIRPSSPQLYSRVDAATFVRNTNVGDGPGRGRGLFATCNIKPGQIVMCEKAFCVVWGQESEALTAITYDLRDDRIRLSPIGLTKSIDQMLLRNPPLIERVMNLYGDYQGNIESMLGTEHGPVVDVFRVHDIVSRDTFGLNNQHNEGSAANKEYVGDFMVVRATRPISAGEEIYISYDQSRDYNVRSMALMTTWGFDCHCPLCAAEKLDDVAMRKKRRDLASEADAFEEKKHWVNAKQLSVAKAQRLARAIDAMYDSQRYNGLPCTATEGIREWLAKARSRREHYSYATLFYQYATMLEIMLCVIK